MFSLLNKKIIYFKSFFNFSTGCFGVVQDNYPVPPSTAVFAAIAHPQYCRTDTANGTKCGDGDAIRFWQDAVSGSWYEQATSGSRFILRSAGGGKWYAEGDGTRKHNFGTISYLATDQTCLGGAASRTATANRVLFGSCIASPADPTDHGAARVLQHDGEADLTIELNYGKFAGGTWDANTDLRVIGLVSNSVRQIYKNASLRTLNENYGTTIGATNAGISIGGYGYSSFGTPFVGSIYGVAIILNPSSIPDFDTWLASLLP